MLVTATAAVALGTLYPLVMDALGLGKISVGAPYFEAVFVPLMTPLVLLMGAAPLAHWKAAQPADMARALRWPAVASSAFALAVPWASGDLSAGVALGLGLAAWVFTGTAALLLQRSRGGAAQLARAGRSFWGMVAAHLGVGVFIVGVTVVRGYESERDVHMAVGDHVELAGYRFTLRAVGETRGPNYLALRAQVQVQGPRGATFVLAPEKRLYKARQMPMTEAAIDAGLTRDVYVALAEPRDADTWTLRIHHKPFVGWIWGGAGLMALGGLLAVADRRYRPAVKTAPSPRAGEALRRAGA
jgi:cytochrome c-type biogenesis protein CcmF